MMNYNSLSETTRFLASSATYEVNWRIVLRAPLYPYPLIRHDLNSARSLQLVQDKPSLILIEAEYRADLCEYDRERDNLTR